LVSLYGGNLATAAISKSQVEIVASTLPLYCTVSDAKLKKPYAMSFEVLTTDATYFVENFKQVTLSSWSIRWFGEGNGFTMLLNWASYWVCTKNVYRCIVYNRVTGVTGRFEISNQRKKVLRGANQKNYLLSTVR
jgi:hypothetical protein